MTEILTDTADILELCPKFSTPSLLETKAITQGNGEETVKKVYRCDLCNGRVIQLRNKAGVLLDLVLPLTCRSI